jgi:hypothetical protein
MFNVRGKSPAAANDRYIMFALHLAATAKNV